jgi:hypothetical protein
MQEGGRSPLSRVPRREEEQGQQGQIWAPQSQLQFGCKVKVGAGHKHDEGDPEQQNEIAKGIRHYHVSAWKGEVQTVSNNRFMGIISPLSVAC